MSVRDSSCNRPPTEAIWRRASCVLLLVATVLGGCGDRGPKKAVVTGKVTYCGEPVVSGEIRFVPDKETPTPSWGALIIDGQYSAFGRGGVPVGTHKVEVYGWRTKERSAGQAASMPLGAAEIPPKEQYLPVKYNIQSELKITIEPGSGKIVRDFALTD